MAKPEKKREARQYRRQGKSMKWIAERIGVARSSVSVWTRDIQLTPEQEEALNNSNERREAQKKGYPEDYKMCFFRFDKFVS